MTDPVYNVLDNGVTGAGNVADAAANTTAIQALINKIAALPAPLQGGEIYFPPGIYDHSGLTLPSFVSLRGPTYGSTALLRNSASTDCITVGAGAQFWGISNLTVLGGVNGVTTAVAGAGESANVVNKGVSKYAAYKFAEIKNVITDGCSANGFNFLTGTYALFASNLFAQGCGNDGFYILGTDSVYQGLYASGNLKVGINVVGANNKIIGAKSIFNGLALNGFTAGVNVSGFRNTLIGVESQDNYTDGFVEQATAIDNQYIGCMADSCGYAHNNTSLSSLIASGFVIGGIGGIFSACRVTSHVGKLPSGTYVTQYPYKQFAAAKPSKVEVYSNMCNASVLLNQ